MRLCSLKKLEKNERDRVHKLLCFLNGELTKWLILFQELESRLGTKFLQKGLDPSDSFSIQF